MEIMHKLTIETKRFKPASTSLFLHSRNKRLCKAGCLYSLRKNKVLNKMTEWVLHYSYL